MAKLLSGNRGTEVSEKDVFHLYYVSLCHFAWQLLRDNYLVEDIVQYAFLVYFKQKDDISDHPIAIKNFLYSTVRNACYNTIRHEKVKVRYQTVAGLREEWEDPETLDAMIRSEVIEQIYRVITTLPEGCQQVFRLGYLEGLANPKIAEKLGISINTVKKQKQRGFKILREQLNPELFLLLSLFHNQIF